MKPWKKWFRPTNDNLLVFSVKLSRVNFTRLGKEKKQKTFTIMEVSFCQNILMKPKKKWFPPLRCQVVFFSQTFRVNFDILHGYGVFFCQKVLIKSQEKWFPPGTLIKPVKSDFRLPTPTLFFVNRTFQVNFSCLVAEKSQKAFTRVISFCQNILIKPEKSGFRR